MRTQRSARRVRGLRHKETRLLIDFGRAHGVTTLNVGNPDEVHTVTKGRHPSQRMASWEYGTGQEYPAPTNGRV